MTYSEANQSWQNKRKSGALSAGEPDFTAIWGDCDIALQFVVAVIGRSDLPADIVADLHKQVGLLQRRRTNPNLYVAIVGEFNSGKSTFINALLRHDLLKRSTIVRTAVATKISYASKLDVEVLFRGQQRFLSYERNREQFKRQLRAIVPRLGIAQEDIQGYLHLVTADKDITPHVQEVLVRHPAKFLEQNIVIIDTPGTNAQSRQHGEITREIIEQEADVAVIAIPAGAALSATLHDFIQITLQPLLHRCLYVVTRLDQVPSEEQRILVDDLYERLTEVVGQDQRPTIYEAAPQVVLDAMRNDKTIPVDLRHWNNRFVELETSIWNHLCYQRTQSIAESLLRLLTELFKNLESHLRTSRADYNTRQSAIEQEVIPNLVSFAENECVTYQERLVMELNRVAEEAEEDLLRIAKETIERVAASLAQATSDDEFNDVVGYKASAIMRDAQDRFIKEFTGLTEAMQQRVQREGNAVKRRFTEAYQRLALLGQISLSVDTAVRHQHISINASTMFSEAEELTESINIQENVVLGGGAAAGAFLGTFLIPVPVLGTLLGGLFGGIFGSFFVSIDKKREAIWEKLLPHITGFFKQLGVQAQATLETYANDNYGAFVQQIVEYTTRYNQIVEMLQEQQRQEAGHLLQLQQTVQADLREIERQLALFQRLQQKLSSKTG